MKKSTDGFTVPKDILDQVDALAASKDCSRNDIIAEALRQYLAANSWQIGRIGEGITAARAGDSRLAEDAFRDIAAKHGWAAKPKDQSPD